MINNAPCKEITLHFCQAKIFENYIYVVMNEGVTVSPKHNDYLVSIADQYFRNKDFFYVTDRKNSYAVDPTVYFETATIKNLKAFVVIQPEMNTINNPVVESLFFDKPFRVVHSLDEAMKQIDVLSKT